MGLGHHGFRLLVLGRAGQGRAGQGRAGQGRAGGCWFVLQFEVFVSGFRLGFSEFLASVCAC